MTTPKIWMLSENELFSLTKSLPFNLIVLTKTGKEKIVTVRASKKSNGLFITFNGAEYLSLFTERENQIRRAYKYKILLPGHVYRNQL